MTQLYRLVDGVLVQVPDGRLAKEESLQDWIEEKPELIGLDVLIIGREVETTYGGYIDLLALDDEGNVAIIELKRDRTPREIIAQVLDYASWVAKLSTAEVRNIATRYLAKFSKTIDSAFQERFGAPMPEALNDQHTMIIVASAFDASSQRIVRYLSEEHEIAINTAFFSVFDEKGDVFLSTNWLLDQNEVAERSESKYKLQATELIDLANNRKISGLVAVCRRMSSVAYEHCAPTYGGSFRYFFKGKLVFGVNVAGVRQRPPDGELDVWLPTPTIENLAGRNAGELRQILIQQFGATEAGKTDCIVRLKSPEMAEKLVSFIIECLSSGQISSKPDG